MKIQKHKITVPKAIIYLALIILSLTMILPFWHILMYSFSPGADAAKSHFMFWPQGFGFEGYRQIFSNDLILTGYWNTIQVTVIGTVLSVGLTMMAAYGLSKKDLPFRGFFTTFIFITMIFGGGLIAQYYTVKSVGLIDTIASMYVPRLVNGFYLIIMRNFFEEIPPSLEESAKLDGANDVKIFARIIIPLSMPLISTMILFHAVEYWNSWYDALLYINVSEKQPLQLLLRGMLVQQNLSQFGTFLPSMAEVVKMVAVVITTLPILLVYPFLQKYFIKGVMIGAIK